MAVVLKRETKLARLVESLSAERKQNENEQKKLKKEIEKVKKEKERYIRETKKKYKKERKTIDHRFLKKYGWIFICLIVMIFAAIAIYFLWSDKELLPIFLFSAVLSSLLLLALFFLIRRIYTGRFVPHPKYENKRLFKLQIKELKKKYDSALRKYKKIMRKCGKNEAEIKGYEGEVEVTRHIEGCFDNNTFLINDITIRFGSKTTQIDHILICPKGIFCIETKNYSLQYYPACDGKWKYYAGRQVKYIHSPQDQSCYHAWMLSNALREENPEIIPLVVFSNYKARYRGSFNPCPVIYFDELPEFIARYPIIYSVRETELIAKKILKLNVKK